MRLPEVENAIVPESKVIQYLLNLDHKDGHEKAVFFLSLGFSIPEWFRLADALRSHAASNPVTNVISTACGTKYVVEGRIESPIGRDSIVRSVWIALSSSRTHDS